MHSTIIFTPNHYKHSLTLNSITNYLCDLLPRKHIDFINFYLVYIMEP